MLVPDRNGCPRCTNPPSYFVTDAATCLLGNPLAMLCDTTLPCTDEKHRVAPSRGPPDPGGYSTIHSSPILTSAVQCSAARRGARHVSFTATVTLGRLQPPGIAKSLIKDIHRRHVCTSACLPRAGSQGCLLPAPSVVTYSAGLHTMSHRITVWPWIAPHPRPRPRPRPILRSRYRAQCRIVPNVRTTTVQYLFPSHRLAKRNACGTKRYGVVACQPVPTACRSSNA